MLRIAQNCDSHFCSPVLDWTVWSSPAFSGTGLDCSPRVSDRTVRSFYRSPFELETGLFFSQTGPYFSLDCGPNWPDRTVWSFSTVYK